MFTWFPSQVYTATGPCSLGASATSGNDCQEACQWSWSPIDAVSWHWEGGVPWSRAMPGYSRGRGCSGNPVSWREDRGHAAGRKPGDGVRRWPGDPGKEMEACQLQVLAALFPVHPNRPRPLPPRSFHSYSSHCTSRYMDWESWPIVLLAVQMYSPASVYWMLFSVREDTRAWLRTTMCPSRVCREGTESVRAQGRMGARRPGHHLCDQSHTLSSHCQCLSLTLGSN